MGETPDPLVFQGHDRPLGKGLLNGREVCQDNPSLFLGRTGQYVYQQDRGLSSLAMGENRPKVCHGRKNHSRILDGIVQNGGMKTVPSVSENLRGLNVGRGEIRMAEESVSFMFL